MAKVSIWLTCEDCGEQFKHVHMCYNSKAAESYEEWAKENVTTCSACREKAHKAKLEKENEESARKSEEMGLPTLTGSPKQIAWANTLRLNLLAFLEKYRETFTECKSKLVLFDEFIGSILSNTEAKFFIDNMDFNVRYAFITFCEKKSAEKELESAVDIIKEDGTKPGTAKIIIEDGKIKAEYVKDDDFIKVVKSVGFSWNGKSWYRKMTEYNGGTDRAVELGYKLVKAGFCVQSESAIIEQIKLGEWNKEVANWVKFKNGKIVITWDRTKSSSDDFYKEANKLHGAKWNGDLKGVAVPAESYAEIRDFCEINSFSISKDAETILSAAEEKAKKIAAVEVAEHEEEKVMTKEEMLNKRLEESRTDEIIADLVDDEEDTVDVSVDKATEIAKMGYSIIPGYCDFFETVHADSDRKQICIHTPSGKIKNIQTSDFDKTVKFGKEVGREDFVEITVRELVRIAYCHTETSLLEAEYGLPIKEIERFKDKMKSNGIVKELNISGTDEFECLGQVDLGDHFYGVAYRKGNVGAISVADYDDEFEIGWEFESPPTPEQICQANSIRIEMIDARLAWRIARKDEAC